MGTLRGVNDKMAAMTAKPRDQSIQKLQKSVSQAKFCR